MKAAINAAFFKPMIIGMLFLFYHETEALGDGVSVLGSLGDSITVACNAASLGDNPTLSWSTGTDGRVNSHLKRLAMFLKADIQGINLAVSGAKVADLGPQTNAIINHKPDYVTIEIGANDLCAWNGDYAANILQFGIELRSNVTKIVESNQKVKILLASIPDMYALWEVGARRPDCQLKWNLFGICSPLLSSNVTTQDRAAFVDRWHSVNSTLASVAESFPQNVIFNAGVASTRFSREHVSPIDCFHPSIQGQDLLAEKAWPYMMSLAR